MTQSNTSQISPDFTHYNELKQQAIAQTSEVQRVVACKFVPLLYDELIKQGLKPKQAASRIYKDLPMWHHDTILHILHDHAPETRWEEKAKGGRAVQKLRKLKSLTEPTIEFILTREQIIIVNISSMESVDGSVRIRLNSEAGFLDSKPVTPKPAKSDIDEPVAVKTETTEPIAAAVKSSSAPIHPT